MQNFPSFTRLAAWLLADAEAKPKSKPSTGLPRKKGPVRRLWGMAGQGGEPMAAPVAREEGAGGGQHSIAQDDSVRGGSCRKDTRPRASWPAVPTPCGTDPAFPAKTPVTGPGGHKTKTTPGRSPTPSPSTRCPGCRCPHAGRALTTSHCILVALLLTPDPNPAEKTSPGYPPHSGEPHGASSLSTAVGKGLPRPSTWRRTCASSHHVQQGFVMEQVPLQSSL